MRKRLPLMVMLVIVMSVLSACAGAGEESPGDVPEQEAKGEVLGQFAEDDGTVWKESWMEKTASGDAIQVDINASVVIPEISQMSTVEVSKYEFNNENKKHVAEAVFDGAIYYGNEEKLPKSELQKLLDEEREGLQVSTESWQEIMDGLEPEGEPGTYEKEKEKELEERRKRVEKYEEMLKNAPDEYVKIQENDYQGERYVGERDSVWYELDFSDQSIRIAPLEQEDVFVDRAKGIDGFVSYFHLQKEEGLDNECNMKQKEAEQLARDFAVKCGFSDLVLKETRDLIWTVEKNNGGPGVDDRFANGWWITFAAGADGVAFDSFGTEGDDIYRVGKEEYPAEKKYSLYCSMNIYVTDRGIIEANYYNPIAMQSVTPGVKLLPLKDIKEIVKNSMGEYAAFYIDKGKKLVGAIRFTYMELVYYRLSDPDHEDLFTYIPAWRLRKDGNQQMYYIVNAMDGSVIRDWESTWTLSEDWLYSRVD